MHIYIGADHRGFARKEALTRHLTAQGHKVIDCGAASLDPSDDYPDYAQAVARRVVTDADARGIVVCGSGAGVCIAANKVSGVRAGLALEPAQVCDATAHDHLTVLCLSADYMTRDAAVACVEAFLATPHAKEERHERRVAQITDCAPHEETRT